MHYMCVMRLIYITNINHIIQSNKDKFFDKTKTIRPKN